MPERYDAIIFDLDGVITDTAEYHYLGWQRMADEEQIPFDREANEQLRGVSRMDSLALILGDRDVDEETFEELAERKNRYYVEHLRMMTPDDLLPGARELLDECRRRRLKIAIGSSSKNAQTVLDRLGIADEFDAVADGHDAERAKPAPDLFLHAADLLGTPPGRCVVFEDAAAGIQAAIAASMLAVGIGPADRLAAAHLRFDSVADVDLDAVLAAERGVTP